MAIQGVLQAICESAKKDHASAAQTRAGGVAAPYSRRFVLLTRYRQICSAIFIHSKEKKYSDCTDTLSLFKFYQKRVFI